MPIIYQKRIYRDDLQANPKVLYVFGDNAKRIGLGGQAKEMRGELNAIGVATKWEPTDDKGAFFYDSEAKLTIPTIEKDLDVVEWHLSRGATVVLPLDGLGTGLSRLPETSPKAFQYLTERVKTLVSIYNK